MKTIDISDATQPLAEYARDVDAPVAITRRGKPIAVLLPVHDADLETVSLSMNPKFWAIMQRSAARHQREGGLTSEQVRQELGLPRRPKATRGARKPKAVSRQ